MLFKNRKIVGKIVFGFVTFGILAGGYYYFGYNRGPQSANEGSLNKKLLEAMQSSKNPQDFRQAISDMAWGRSKQAKQEVVQRNTATETVDLSEQQQQINMQMLQGRISYCARNKHKDKTCR